MPNIGVIGLGMMGRMHIESYASIPGANLVAIADADPQRAKGDLSSTWGNLPAGGGSLLDMSRVKGFTNYRDLLALPEVDVVDICLPTPCHHEAALAALAAGKHVVCEKPLARTLDQARQIAAAAKKAKGFFMPAMCIRFWPAYVWLKHAVVTAPYGKVLAASFQRLGSYPPGWFRDGKQSGGALLDLHIHDVDFVYYLFGSPQAVTSQGYAAATGQVDHVLTHYHYKNVPLVVAEGGWAFHTPHPFRMTWHVNFEHATVEMTRDGKVTLYRDNRAETVNIPDGMGYPAELAYFLQCVQAGVRPTTVTADDAVESLRIAFAEQLSIKTRKPIPLKTTQKPAKKAPAKKKPTPKKSPKKKPAKKKPRR
ncbi:MAG: Gfo/Idh/MocA family oxidoreductase [Phycisphaeraceae bacterium]|nr:Gfo/Idh/MocA family oxidoreductase [Phycisphaeraceae bacterium]